MHEQLSRDTPYGDTSADLLLGSWQDSELVFLPRHGPQHRIPPHQINFRANIWALKKFGVRQVIAVNAVGGITAEMAPLTLVIPHQIIDYSSARQHTFADGNSNQVHHVDFTEPYSAELRAIMKKASVQKELALVTSAIYACTNGPRLETAAEISRLKNDGCNIVGMTAMPEAVLAREIGLEYAAVALVVNWAAGIDSVPISMPEIMANIEQGMERVISLLSASVGLVDQ